MTTLDRRTLLAGMGAGLLAACEAPRNGSDLAEAKKPAEGGIGGTGIVGTLTDFSSLIVNGLRVATPPDMRVTTALGPARAADLAIGQSLTIEAARAEAGLAARRVHITHPVIGTVGRAAPDGQRGEVAGVPVLLEPGAIGRLTPGQRVALSGLWRGGQVIASRLDPVAGGLDVIAGVAERDEGRPQGGRLRVGGVPVDLQGRSTPPVGSFVTVTGAHQGDRLVAAEIVLGRFVGAAGPLEALSVEGYLDPIPTAPFYAVSGLGHSFDAGAELAPFRESRSVFSGPYSGTFDVATGLMLPEAFEPRRALIRRIAAGETSKLLRPAR